MKYRLIAATAAVAVSSLLGGMAAAQAAIIGASPDTNFANGSTSFAIGHAQYTLTNNPNQFNQLSVATGGSAQVSLFGTPPNVPHKPGGVGDGVSLPTKYSYDSFPDATPSPTFSFFGPYLGLKFLLDDGTHYGYAKIANSNTLVDYAYNSVAGGSITTGAAIEQGIGNGGTAVPEPSSLAMLGLGLFLLGGAAMARRRATLAPNSKSRAV